MSAQPGQPASKEQHPAAETGEDPCKSIFLTLAEAEPDARRAELDRLARSDPALHTRVAALLAAHDRAATPLDAPPSWTWTSAGTTPADTSEHPEADSAPRPGDQLGPYTVESLLGSGAMGVVFAARHAGTNRVVALKLIRPDASSAAARRRFEPRAAPSPACVTPASLRSTTPALPTSAAGPCPTSPWNSSRAARSPKPPASCPAPTASA